MLKRRSFAGLTAVLLVAGTMPSLRAQRASAPAEAADSAAEASAVARGWALLSDGRIADAAAAAEQTLGNYPRSLAALSLVIETESARAGATGALDAYERWLGDRKIEDPYILRRIATVFLREAAGARQDPAVRLAALDALAAEGDAAALAALRSEAASGSRQDDQKLAELGDRASVRRLVSQLALPATTGTKMSVVASLGSSRDPEAIPPLMTLLSDTQHPDLQAAAAEGLGQLGARDAIGALRHLYEDTSQTLGARFAAAGSLYRMDDMSGIDLINQTLSSDTPAVRLGALQVMSSRPDAAWLQNVRDVMAQADQPDVRLAAARLLAPYDPDAARAATDAASQSENLAVRELAARVLAEQVASDFATLRQLLRAGEGLARVQAAGRILTLTR